MDDVAKFKTACPHCDKPYTLAAKYQGKAVKCAACQGSFRAEPAAEALPTVEPMVEAVDSIRLQSQRPAWGLAAIAAIVSLAVGASIGFVSGREKSKSDIARLEADAVKANAVASDATQSASRSQVELKAAQDTIATLEQKQKEQQDSVQVAQLKQEIESYKLQMQMKDTAAKIAEVDRVALALLSQRKTAAAKEKWYEGAWMYRHTQPKDFDQMSKQELLGVATVYHRLSSLFADNEYLHRVYQLATQKFLSGTDVDPTVFHEKAKREFENAISIAEGKN